MLAIITGINASMRAPIRMQSATKACSPTNAPRLSLKTALPLPLSKALCLGLKSSLQHPSSIVLSFALSNALLRKEVAAPSTWEMKRAHAG
ncbi:hypothetical protein M5689_006525 [Euphorbia peplus]|nr:hypothetical protein M5689_006525 [Euphorbia peplus]